MTVYVDTLRSWPQPATGGARYFGSGKSSCHMEADTREELLAFAAKIGLKAAWLQTASICEHFDLTPSKRTLAVAAGAVEVPSVYKATRGKDVQGTFLE